MRFMRSVGGQRVLLLLVSTVLADPIKMVEKN